MIMKKGLFVIVFMLVSFLGFSQDSAGVYNPAISDSANITSIVEVGPAHFILSGNQCTVWGRVALTAFHATNTHTYFTISLPFASTFDNTDDAVGGLTATQSANTLTPGFVWVNPANKVQIFWNQIFNGGTNVRYSFIYTVK